MAPAAGAGGPEGRSTKVSTRTAAAGGREAQACSLAGSSRWLLLRMGCRVACSGAMHSASAVHQLRAIVTLHQCITAPTHLATTGDSGATSALQMQCLHAHDGCKQSATQPTQTTHPSSWLPLPPQCALLWM